ncbi:hypothetical protein PIB30_071386 [Stylosanthes scabra]|uniref:Uncharacterized protein n=1 Tax=Stylosanthes scabra TaxID=79078 RepID=A0ABU6QPT2_9FABA|nr:hypothetical protein [Stylosanthes scabra]
MRNIYSWANMLQFTETLSELPPSPHITDTLLHLLRRVCVTASVPSSLSLSLSVQGSGSQFIVCSSEMASFQDVLSKYNTLFGFTTFSLFAPVPEMASFQDILVKFNMLFGFTTFISLFFPMSAPSDLEYVELHLVFRAASFTCFLSSLLVVKALELLLRIVEHRLRGPHTNLKLVRCGMLASAIYTATGLVFLVLTVV